MRTAAALLALHAWMAVAASPVEPSNPTIVFYNARIALRDDKPADVLKLWLVRNILADRGELAPEDEEFRSAVWVATGRLGICQDGYAKDVQGGAGLWPLALHNWVLESMFRSDPQSRPAPFDAFEIGRQQRLISLSDVPSPAELSNVAFFRGFCLTPYLEMMGLGELPILDLKDRLASGTLLRHLLRTSQRTLATHKVKNTAIIEARIFDLDLALTELHASRLRRQGAVIARRAKEVGLSEAGVGETRSAGEQWPKGSPQAAFLEKSLKWTAGDWLSLSSDRRLFLFNQARVLSEDAAALDRLELAIIDGLIARRAGSEVEAWIGFFQASGDLERRRRVTSGDRGKRLLELERETGFRERATIALHRGVSFLEAGDRMESLRSFAFAMQHSGGSHEAAVVLSLARRWISNVLARYDTNEEVVATLRALVPNSEYNALIEDLVWRAAVRADRASFELVTRSYERRGGLEATVAKLRPLAGGKPGQLAGLLRDGLDEEPYLTLRFMRRYLEHLETEEADVRRANVPLLRHVSELLAALSTSSPGRPSTHQRNAEELLGRTQAILDGLRELDGSLASRSRMIAPRHDTFAGSIRLAPVDPLPWPFQLQETAAPSAFSPLRLEPVEWRDDAGALVFGWRIME